MRTIMTYQLIIEMKPYTWRVDRIQVQTIQAIHCSYIVSRDAAASRERAFLGTICLTILRQIDKSHDGY